MIGYVAFGLLFALLLAAVIDIIRRIARTYPQVEEIDHVDVRLGTLARRFEHSDSMSVEELETEADRILRGETMYQLDGMWRSYEPVMVCSNEPVAIWPKQSSGGTVYL